jgi:hypothetical protein
MQVKVTDANGVPVQGATVNIEQTGSAGLTLVSSVTTDASGMATFTYVPTQKEQSSNLVTLMITAYKDGYQLSRASKVFEVDSSTAILPPIPIIGSAFSGLPSWSSYAVLGGIAAIGGGIYLLKRPEAEEDNESLTETSTPEEQKEVVEEPIDDTVEDEEEEET